MRTRRINRWLVVPAGNSSAARDIIMFPFAGGGPSSYVPWVAELSDIGRVIIVELPGRESRIDEPPILDPDQVINSITHALADLSDRPTVFFGHSLGALLAYEVCRTLLAKKARLPEAIFVSGRPPPHVQPRHEPIHLLPREKFFAKIAEFGAISPEVMGAHDLLDYFEPILRADFEMHVRFGVRDTERLPIPLIALGGEDDHEFPPQDIALWRDASARSTVHRFTGGHFFLNEHRPAIAALMRQHLQQLASAPVSVP